MDEDVKLIDLEEFDFDLPVTPSASPSKSVAAAKRQANTTGAKVEDEEEVFFGPVGFTEECIASGVREETFKPLSPIPPDLWAHLAQEAFKVAYHIGNAKSTTKGSGKKEAAIKLPTSSDIRRPLSSVFQAMGRNSSNISSKGSGCETAQLVDIGDGNQEETSQAKKSRKRSGTFTKENAVEDLVKGSGCETAQLIDIGDGNLEETSQAMKSRKRSGTFTKENAVEDLVKGSGCETAQLIDIGDGNQEETSQAKKSRKRSGTFTKENAVEDLLDSPKKRTRLAPADVPVTPDLITTAEATHVVVSTTVTKSKENIEAAKAERRSSTVTKSKDNKDVAKAERQAPEKADEGGVKGGAGAASKLKPPTSRLLRYNKSQSNLAAQPKAGVPLTERKQVANTEDKLKKIVSTGICKTERRLSVHSKHESETKFDKPPTSNNKPSVGIKRSQSMNYKSNLPSMRSSKLALPQYTSASQLDKKKEEELPAPSSSSSNSRRSSGIPTGSKGPTTKPQLIQPGQFQRRSLALVRGKSSATVAQSGPLKATAVPAANMGDTVERPSKPAPKSNLGDTVERPFNPALALATAVGEGNNSQCPNTPSVQKRTEPKILSLSSEGSTPARSSVSSSVFGSTPGSLKRGLSLLPTPSKRRSVTGLPPPSPMTGISLSSKGSLASISSTDIADSPFVNPAQGSRVIRNRRTSGVKASCSGSDIDLPEASPFAFKPRKALVGNTPDLPKRTLSRWSPLRRNLPSQLEDQVSMCTKRVTPE